MSRSSDAWSRDYEDRYWVNGGVMDGAELRRNAERRRREEARHQFVAAWTFRLFLLGCAAAGAWFAAEIVSGLARHASNVLPLGVQ